ncbi:type IV conjugative transfer system coupling protein TraD [Photobacterium damselae]|uniref:type IV conjugative transfer system coupling protein TraD n=1 Tax=Photobacterium damselae TaxID=38293 RepID=UPI004067F964
MLSKHRKRPKSDSQAFTRGGQIFFHNWRMYFQIIKKISSWGLWISAFFTIAYCYFFISANEWAVIQAYFNAKMSSMNPEATIFLTHDNKQFEYVAKELLAKPKFIDDVHSTFRAISLAFAFSFVAMIAFLTSLSRYFTSKGKEQTQDYLVRGVEIVTPKELEKRIKQKKKPSTFKIDGLQILPNDFEIRHLSFSGSTGTGKSVAIRKLIREIRARGDKAIIYDKGCTFVSRFYDPKTDYILNPFDERSVDWKIWYDAAEFSDFENLATGLIADTGHGDPFWIEAARTIFTNTAYQMMQDGKELSIERLLDYTLNTPTSELREFLKGTSASSITDEKADKIAVSVKSILATYIKSLRYLEGLDKPDKNGKMRKEFSVQDWVLDDNQKGFLYLTSNAQQHVSLRPLISMWLSTASTAILGLNESASRRIWVIMDELPSLHKLPDLASTLAEVRKHGGCYLVGFQSYAQFVKVYGQHAADEMYDLLNTRFYFRNPSSPMAERASKDLGEQEVEISKEQYSYGANTVRDGISLGHQTITRPAVMPSEIMELDDLQCWYRTFGGFPITRLDLAFDDMPSVAPSFIKREYESSKQMKRIDGEIAHYQIGALLALPDKDKQTLLRIHRAQHEDQGTYDEERDRMKEDAQKLRDALEKEKETKLRNNDQELEEQKLKEEKEMKRQLETVDQTDQAFKEMEETTISADIEP